VTFFSCIIAYSFYFSSDLFIAGPIYMEGGGQEVAGLLFVLFMRGESDGIICKLIELVPHFWEY
jgi:hypothetical protein